MKRPDIKHSTIAAGISIAIFASTVGCARQSQEERKPTTDSAPADQTGERFEFDDFYHANGGTWILETPVDLLKEQKFVSGEIELQHYLVYAAATGERVVMREGDGRWKLLDVVKDDTVVASGWVDANRKQARIIP